MTESSLEKAQNPLKRKNIPDEDSRSLDPAATLSSNAPPPDVAVESAGARSSHDTPHDQEPETSQPKKNKANGRKKSTASTPHPKAAKRGPHPRHGPTPSSACRRPTQAVQAQLGKGQDLTVEDVARVKVLVPRAVRFEYVDEARLEVMTAGEKDLTDHGRNRRGLWTEEDLRMPSSEDGGDHSGLRRDVLLFEFVDGDLKREVPHPKTGEPSKPVRRMKDEDLKMPVYSQKQMLGLIEKRNNKFTDAIHAFLIQCEDQGTDPVEILEQEKDTFLPTPPGNGVTSPAVAKAPATIPKERKSIAEIIAEIREMEWYHAQIVPEGHRVFDAQTPVYGDLTFQLSQDLVNALYNTKSITQLYSHQAEAINHLYEGHNVIVSTSTSSGKSLIYQIPMLHELEKEPDSRGMYIFPTKALAQDQRRSMMDLLQYMNGLQHTMVETFDGDTPFASRNLIRDEARIIFTNPDMLHITILPQENAWRTYLKNLKFVVVDELHVYNGLFGSHVALVMRRLRRICAAVGNRHVKFISCSATVANPEEHMKSIFGVQDVRLIDFDGSPSGRKEFICWNTPFKDPADPTSGRGDSVAETARLFCQLVLRGVRVIAFCRIRKLCEILLQAVRNEFQALERPEIGKMVMGYRGGYSPQDRRRIEKEMFEGKLMGIVATNALELGVDIGSLDAVITLGFPYSISNLRQQSGRAGRRNKDSLSVLVGDRYPTDQHYMQNPDEIFTRPNCELQIDLANELILEGHVQCAAFEMPIRPDEDSIYFGEQIFALTATRLVKDSMGFYHCHERFRPQPSRCISIRDTEDQHFAVIDTTNNRNVVLEEVEASRAFFTIYEGGIFLHQGQTYLVQELNPERHFARVVRVHVDWSTMQRDFTDIDPIETETMRSVGSDPNASRAFFGSVQIHAVVYGFFKIDKRGRVLDAVAVDNPPIDLLTKGMWLDVPSRAIEILQSHRLNIAAAIHAAEHAVAKKELGRPLRRATDSLSDADLQKILQPPSRQRPARLTFYDAKGGSCGSGIAAKAFEFVGLLLCRAVARIEACACLSPQGCVECVCDERCKEMNVVMSKAGAGVILRCLLAWDVDVDGLPWGEDVEGEGFGVGGAGELAGGLETVVRAEEVPWKAGCSPDGEQSRPIEGDL
ncbi:uncharacterized protein N7498_001598 [Penicillium cinerascens]|uniref:DEAD/DEAH box helicase n=1 Tax=Penicillium cinerascens TaxID=70096 RepID=A0A9W9N8M1_9EURO|nr:uncharacterized protein N7498_001598 [Penicillium cinerascens]KAJ5215191.1 hypothetical protein N7498_001598 [Penicillium cinerascens]